MAEEQLSKQVLTAIRCQDIQTGLHGYSIADFDVLLRVGMAGRLAIHIRGGDVVDYDRLKEVSFYLFDIPKIAFDGILNLLADIEFVRLATVGQTVKTIIPTVPYFDDMYERLGNKAELEGLNEFEQISIAILDRLSKSPQDHHTLRTRLDLDPETFERVLKIGEEGSYIHEIARPRGSLLISPVYFSENPDIFAEAVEKYGETMIKNVIELMRKHPGVPYELVLSTGQLGEVLIPPDELAILKTLAENAVTQPPLLETTYSGKNHFLFTPPMGTERIPVVEKEIYEKAMAVVATMRQGQYFPLRDYRIKWPIAIIEAFLDPSRGELKATSFAKEQYSGLAIRKVCHLVNAGGNWYYPKFIDLPENRKAMKLARHMLTSPVVIEERGLDDRARDIIYSVTDYREALRGYGDIKKRKQIPASPSEQERQFSQILENLQMGC